MYAEISLHEFYIFAMFFFLANIFFPTTHAHDPRPTMVARLTSDFKTFHITLKSQTPPITRLEGAFLKYQQYLKTVFLTAFSPRPLPHRFLSVLGSAFARLNLLLCKPRKKKTDQKIPPAPQAVVITRVANGLILFQTLIETTVIYFLPDIWRLFVLSGCSQGDSWHYISTWSFENRVA